MTETALIIFAIAVMGLALATAALAIAMLWALWKSRRDENGHR
jgi:NADH:ubiquinone oxidoreductase subunit K